MEKKKRKKRRKEREGEWGRWRRRRGREGGGDREKEGERSASNRGSRCNNTFAFDATGEPRS